MPDIEDRLAAEDVASQRDRSERNDEELAEELAEELDIDQPADSSDAG